MIPRPYVFESRLRFVDTDASGRIHYTAIFRHFEAAEFEFLRALGVPYRFFRDETIGYPRVRVECDFLGPIIADDLMAITVTVDRIGTTSFTLAFSVAVGQRPSAAGKITIVAIDRQTARPRPLPDQLAEALRSHATP